MLPRLLFHPPATEAVCIGAFFLFSLFSRRLQPPGDHMPQVVPAHDQGRRVAPSMRHQLEVVSDREADPVSIARSDATTFERATRPADSLTQPAR